MSKIDAIFKELDPYGRINFDTLFDFAPPVNKTYPPYTLLQSKDGSKAKFQFAVAGFTMDDLNVTFEDGKLIVEGICPEVDVSEEWDILHKGISARNFKLTFAINRNFEVDEAYMNKGLLIILLKKVTGFAKRIPIRAVDTPALNAPAAETNVPSGDDQYVVDLVVNTTGSTTDTITITGQDGDSSSYVVNMASSPSMKNG